ncbi:MAG: DUF3467 domain-containing protein [Candidatus Heimdallarchaeota archaeon]|nr:DUF3467 domain-containing protein [Candidatus Heimdallarchaeota archaeon]
MKPPVIKIEGQDKSSLFASEFHCLHTPHEFLLTVLEVLPQMKFVHEDVMHPTTNQPGKVARLKNDFILQKIIGRYAMSPASFKKLVNVLNQNLKKYEEKFGEIDIHPPEFMH